MRCPRIKQQRRQGVSGKEGLYFYIWRSGGTEVTCEHGGEAHLGIWRNSLRGRGNSKRRAPERKVEGAGRK